MRGLHLIKTWSRTQDAITLSSAEAELVALGKLAMELLGLRSMCEEWQLSAVDQVSELYADASAALSIAKRQGAGKMRHINVKSLWLQEKALQSLQVQQSAMRRQPNRRADKARETRIDRSVSGHRGLADQSRSS